MGTGSTGMISVVVPLLFRPSEPPLIKSPPPLQCLTFPRRGRGSAAAAAAGAAGARRRSKYKGTAMREEKLAEMIEKKVAEAMEACDGDHGGSDGCRVAWDEVEEVSQAKAHLRRKMADTAAADPLHYYCEANPDTDECTTIYDD